MNPTEATSERVPAAENAPVQGEQHGDRLIVGLWIAMALAVARALLQSVVDATADGESGARLAEHWLEHLVDATSRVWIIVPPLAVLPRGRGIFTAGLRAVAAFGLSVALLAGWPDGELRYTPGFDSTRGLQGWAAIVTLALATVALDRYVTSPHRRVLAWQPATRLLFTAAVLLMGGGAVATVSYVLDRHRLNMEVDAIVRDLLEELPRARASSGAGGRPVEVGSILADRGGDSAGGNKPSLLVPPGASVEFDVELPWHTSLDVCFAADRTVAWPRGDPEPELTFVVTLDGREVLAETIRPRSRADHRNWSRQRIPLTLREEQSARLGFAVRGSGAGVEKARTGFGRPLLVRREWRPRLRSDAARMNVVLVVVDSLRPDHLGCYGGSRGASEQIDRIAAESIVYERAHAPSSWTWPSVASLFTGLGPPEHGVEDFDRCFLSDSLETIAEAFARRGCTTLGVTANPMIARAKNFDQGFEEWSELQLKAAPRIAEEFQNWVRRYAGYQFFAYVHFTDPHRPWNPPFRYAEPFVSAEEAGVMRHAVNELMAKRLLADRARGAGPLPVEEPVAPNLSEQALIGLYDGEIACVDAAIERMWRALADERLLDRTIFVLTSPQGEVLAATSPPTGASLERELLHVPLIVRDPREAPRRERTTLDLTALRAAILEATAPREEAERARERAPEGPESIRSPWRKIAAGTAYAHTSRGRLPDRSSACELAGVLTDDWRLLREVRGAIVEFAGTEAAARGSGEEAARVRAQLEGQLERWYEECRKRSVSRRFERMDYATQCLMRDVGAK